jgi:hypothetical protein
MEMVIILARFRVFNVKIVTIDVVTKGRMMIIMMVIVAMMMMIIIVISIWS